VRDTLMNNKKALVIDADSLSGKRLERETQHLSPQLPQRT
jgi:hypothetical protein